MKKYFSILLLFMTTTAISASAQLSSLGIFNHVGIGVHAATTGFGFEVSTPITPWIQMRAGMSFMPDFSFKTDVDASVDLPGNNSHSSSFDIEAGLKRTQGSVIFNIYPLGKVGSFFIAGGAYFGGADIITISGHSTDSQLNQYLQQGANGYIEIGDYKLPIDKNGYTGGSLRSKNFRPYVGIGFGHPCPKKRISFMTELGVQFMGKMKVYDIEGKEVPVGNINNDDDWQKVMDKLTVYPVLKFTLNGRIF